MPAKDFSRRSVRRSSRCNAQGAEWEDPERPQQRRTGLFRCSPAQGALDTGTELDALPEPHRHWSRLLRDVVAEPTPLERAWKAAEATDGEANGTAAP
jgi:hypothetical protein